MPCSTGGELAPLKVLLGLEPSTLWIPPSSQSQWSVCGKRFDPIEARTVGSDEKNLASQRFALGTVDVTQASKVWGEVPLPEDLEGATTLKVSHSLMDDDEDFAADEASGDLPSGEDDGSTPWPPVSESTSKGSGNLKC
ncbi:Basement membrane-specific heparan sulfate proteoglycan core protein [Dissostichus eleginoides]|uniref:Basement membrane-specific heparan sulfate proteoglycan core protein n=1 Tax=Dissostichus eleginoides TaxID=100907 RepID=A0AAD9CAX3_DISEL|nr:Basement membrane-specific heparan sulfate proteoglycan core protein [Dissostichus eleginoides]